MIHTLYRRALAMACAVAAIGGLGMAADAAAGRAVLRRVRRVRFLPAVSPPVVLKSTSSMMAISAASPLRWPSLTTRV